MRDRLPQPGAGLRNGPSEIANRREKPTNIFYFGNQKITTKVFMMAPADREAIALDVVDYMWEENHELVATRE